LCFDKETLATPGRVDLCSGNDSSEAGGIGSSGTPLASSVASVTAAAMVTLTVLEDASAPLLGSPVGELPSVNKRLIALGAVLALALVYLA